MQRNVKQMSEMLIHSFKNLIILAYFYENMINVPILIHV